MKYVFSLDLKVGLFKMSNASLVEDEIDDHSTGKWTKRQYLYEFVFGVTFCLKMRDSGVNTPPAKVKETSIN